jgi:flagellar protein FlgJ
MAGSPPIDLKSLLGQASSSPASATGTLSAAAQQRAKLKQATQDFEAIFLGMMLKQMRQSMTGSNALFGNSSEAKLYQEMLDEVTAKQMSQTGAFGLGNVLYKKLESILPADPEAAPKTDKSSAKG